jgi:hypothetical protein
MTRVVIKPRGVKSREREANSRRQMKSGVAQSRGVVDPEWISFKVMAMGISSQRRGGHANYEFKATVAPTACYGGGVDATPQ